MRTFLKLLLVCIAMLGAGCEDKETRVYPSIASCDLVIIHHDGDGRLIDFVAFSELGDEKLIRVKPTRKDKDLFFVTLHGVKVSQCLEPENASMSSMRKGHCGRIDLGIRNGKVDCVVDDGKLSPSPVSETALEIVESFLVAKRDSFLKESTIKVVERFPSRVVDAAEEAPESEEEPTTGGRS